MKDEKEYEKYIKKSSAIFNRYNGEYLAVDNEPIVLEGKWNYSRCVLIKFCNKEDLQAWYNSVEYQEILKYRLAGADCDTIILDGKD
jgi:uncharacterized protein (DUF1330 family)